MCLVQNIDKKKNPEELGLGSFEREFKNLTQPEG